MAVTLATFEDWLDRYFLAWVTNRRDQVEALFTEDAVYWVDPFEEPRRGRGEIVETWVGRPHAAVEYTYEPIAVSGDVGVAHWRLSSRTEGKTARTELDGILLIAFATDGRCREHREWYSLREV
jgi:ketosteroid isomerase-like protein